MLAHEAAADSHTRWRPYEDEPLFVPEVLTGFHSMEASDAQRLVRYLTGLVAQRATVHTAVAFNAVYFGYDLSFNGYVGGPVDFDSFPEVSFEEAGDALPIGAMVTLRAGSTPLPAEVVHRESSGEPGKPCEQGPFVRPERLVCDFDAFSPGTVISATHLNRLRAHSRWVDASGHLLHQARYATFDAAQRGDRERFVEYLLGPGRVQLMAGPLPLLLTDGAGEEQFAAALHAALDTVSEALAAASELRTWRDYAFTGHALSERLEDDGPLGRPDMECLVRSVIRPPRGRDGRVRDRRTEVGPFLRSLSRTEHALTGTGYLDSVVHANTLVDDHLRAHGRSGVLPNGVRVRLADPHHEGGLWSTGPVLRPEVPDAPPEGTVTPAPPPYLAEYIVEYDVAAFLRRLPDGQRASDAARAEYHRLLSRFGAVGDLPAGFTLVRGHSRSRGRIPPHRATVSAPSPTAST